MVYEDSERTQYDFSHHIVCPTCHAMNQSRVIWTVGNFARAFANCVVAGLIIWSPSDFSFTRECRKCHARFRARRRLKEPTCWKCGYLLKGLPEPRCPECGTRFDRPGGRTQEDAPE